MITVLWTEDTSDWKVATLGVPAVEANYQRIIDGEAAGNYSKEGIVVLTHELNNQTMSLAEQFLPQIQSKFTGGVMPVSYCRSISALVPRIILTYGSDDFSLPSARTTRSHTQNRVANMCIP